MNPSAESPGAARRAVPKASRRPTISGSSRAAVPVPGPGQVLVRNVWLSVEPAMRGWVNAAANYSEPVRHRRRDARVRRRPRRRVRTIRPGRWARRSPGCSAGRTTPSSTAARSSAASRRPTCRCPLRSACSASTASPRTTACCTSASPSPARPSSCRPRPARWVPASARSPSCMAAARSASRAAKPSAGSAWSAFGFDAAVDYKAPDFAERAGRGLRRWRRCLLRQHRRGDQRRGDGAPERRRARRGLRHRVGGELGPAAARARASSATCSSSARACRAS